MLLKVRVGRRLNAIENKQNICVRDIILGVNVLLVFFVVFFSFVYWFLVLASIIRSIHPFKLLRDLVFDVPFIAVIVFVFFQLIASFETFFEFFFHFFDFLFGHFFNGFDFFVVDFVAGGIKSSGGFFNGHDFLFGGVFFPFGVTFDVTSVVGNNPSHFGSGVGKFFVVGM